MAGPPVTHPGRFFGRGRELRRLFNLWERTPLQNAAIIGPRRSGKTSLLLHLRAISTAPSRLLRPGQRADWLPLPERYRWAYVDFQDPRMGSSEVLLRSLLTCLDLPIPEPCDLELFLEVVGGGLRTPAIVLLDELGVALERYPELDDRFWEGLRSLASSQVGGNLAFVLATHEDPRLIADRSGLGSPFFNIFGYAAYLGPLTEPEALELVESSPYAFSPDDVAWILETGRRWPILLQILCRERLIALEDGQKDTAWREDALRQIDPYQYLLETP